MDDLQARIRRGDLAALLDPALELELLARPDPDGWALTLRSAAAWVISLAAQRLRGRTVVRALDEWGREIGVELDEHEQERWASQRAQIASAPSHERRAALLARFVRGVTLDQWDPLAAQVALGRRLVALLPEPVAEYDAVLARLSREEPKAARRDKG